MTSTKNDKAHDLNASLESIGQSFWLDFITRDFVRGGDLKKLIDENGLRGMTSNPTIFEKAIASGNSYDDQIKELVGKTKSGGEVFEALAIRDISDACDLFRPVFDKTKGLDGYVSIEVSPTLAKDTQGSVEEGRRLWKTIGRPNVMIKIPGTKEGIPAIKQLLSEGINVNVTLLFARSAYENVMEAYVSALEERAKKGEPVDRIASVASFFVSRVDTAVDKLLEGKIAAAKDEGEKTKLKALLGKAAIANARLAYEGFRKVFEGERFRALAAKGAHVQRPLWASTSTKNPAYRDVLYIEELIGPNTVDTIPLEALKAFFDHGKVAATLDTRMDEAKATFEALKAAGIDLDAVTNKLEEEGVASFAKSFETLLAGVDKKRESFKSGGASASA